jgi:hypothetical protein
VTAREDAEAAQAELNARLVVMSAENGVASSRINELADAQRAARRRQ